MSNTIQAQSLSAGMKIRSKQLINLYVEKYKESREEILSFFPKDLPEFLTIEDAYEDDYNDYVEFTDDYDDYVEFTIEFVESKFPFVIDPDVEFDVIVEDYKTEDIIARLSEIKWDEISGSVTIHEIMS